MNSARILAVDDQLYFRVFLEDLLEREDFEVATAGSGAEALALMEEDLPDLVLTDLVMPEMDGRELVRQVKERWPDQEIVVVTSVGDVKTAVEAMQLGATDYLLKPIDRTALLRSVDGILERRAMRAEHDRLVAENISFMGHFAQYERALGLFSTLSVEPLADRIVETLCLETNAHAGVAWLADPDQPSRLQLSGVGGMIRIKDEVEKIEIENLPSVLSPLADPSCRSLLPMGTGAPRSPLFVPIRHGGEMLGLLRLTDRVDGAEFDEGDREVAERFALFASQALANAMAFRSLERRSFKDPTTHAYTRAYFDDVLEHELQKAKRFGRSLSLVRIALDPIGPVRERLSPPEFNAWIQAAVGDLQRAVRETDLLGTETDHEYLVLLPECDSLGSVVAKRRLRAAFERSSVFEQLADDRPAVLSAMATFPSNGTDPGGLRNCLDQRINEDRRSLLRTYDMEQAPFRKLLEGLLAEGEEGGAALGAQMAGFLLDEVGRNPHHRGLLFVAPPKGQTTELRSALEQLRGTTPRTDVILFAERDDQLMPGVPVTWVAPPRVGADQPFLVYLGEGASYAFVQDGNALDATTFHTADPVVVEQLAFGLSHDLGIPIGD
ncbi:MAG: response regulator [bacterium]|nr:response regulator [bacterium]MCP5071298.1 response regulator [bacterium]